MSVNVWDVNTKSSNSSASALNLFTKPFRPKDPDLPNVMRGLNFEDKAVSKKTMRGYAIGTPMLVLSLKCQQQTNAVTELYNEVLNPGW